MQEETFTLQQLAARFEKHPRTIQRWIDGGKLKVKQLAPDCYTLIVDSPASPLDSPVDQATALQEMAVQIWRLERMVEEMREKIERLEHRRYRIRLILRLKPADKIQQDDIKTG